MPETEPTPNLNLAEAMNEQYPEYISIARFMVTEDAQEYGITPEDVQRITKPDERYLDWASKAMLGNKDLVLALAQVASALGEANRIGLAPMLYDPEWEHGEKIRDIGTNNRLHFLRHFVRDCRAQGDQTVEDGLSPIFYE